MTEVNNVDSILIPREQAMAENKAIPSDPVNQEPKVEESGDLNQEIAEKPQDQEIISPKEEIKADSDQDEYGAKDLESKPDQGAKSSPIDEYGNPVEKPKVYTEEEVNRMMRERFSRGKYSEQPQHVQQQIKQEAKDFQPDPNSEESWETQLEGFVERTLEKRQAKVADQQWRENEARKQADFEAKFTTGMQKYSDFHKVVEGKPITNDMLLATRTLDNPAAFIYGASKLHPQELDRIARLDDPFVRAAEVGRLHERMVKERKASISNSKPLAPPKGDLPNKAINQPSLEDRISQYAKQKRK